MDKKNSELELEARRATEMLRGKSVSVVWRHRSSEVGIQFEDGTRLFINHAADGAVELSVTEGESYGS